MHGKQLITTPFGARSTATEMVEGLDLTGRRAIVTCASSGIGMETPRALASTGAEVAPWAAYARPKTADILIAIGAGKRWAADRIAVKALNLGRIATTGVSRHIGEIANAPASFEPGRIS